MNEGAQPSLDDLLDSLHEAIDEVDDENPVEAWIEYGDPDLKPPLDTLDECRAVLQTTTELFSALGLEPDTELDDAAAVSAETSRLVELHSNATEVLRQILVRDQISDFIFREGPPPSFIPSDSTIISTELDILFGGRQNQQTTPLTPHEEDRVRFLERTMTRLLQEEFPSDDDESDIEALREETILSDDGADLSVFEARDFGVDYTAADLGLIENAEDDWATMADGYGEEPEEDDF